MKKLILIILVAAINLSFSELPFIEYKDFIVNSENETIYGKIEWVSNTTIFLINKKGKQKYRANQILYFKRGDFKFVSIKTEYPEFLLEVIKGAFSLYKESHLKSRTVDFNYKKSAYIIHQNKLYTFIYPFGKSSKNSLEISSSNFKLEFEKMVGKENPINHLVKNRNITIKDIQYIVEISNLIFDDNLNLNQIIKTELPKSYGYGFIINKSNDTISGAIKIKENSIFKDAIKLIDSNHNKYEFEIEDLKGFQINNRNYLNKTIKNKTEIFLEIIQGEISLYKNIRNLKSYLQKNNGELVFIDKKYKFNSLFEDKKNVFLRIKENDYKRFEIRSTVNLYNNAP